jgi:hypothetical protein
VHGLKHKDLSIGRPVAAAHIVIEMPILQKPPITFAIRGYLCQTIPVRPSHRESKNLVIR